MREGAVIAARIQKRIETMPEDDRILFILSPEVRRRFGSRERRANADRVKFANRNNKVADKHLLLPITDIPASNMRAIPQSGS
jgi:hypothetical protein